MGDSETCALRGGRGVVGDAGAGVVFPGTSILPRRWPHFLSVSHGSLCLSGGLALAQVLFFYVKYLVLFGVPALLMRLDGLRPPPLPRCVSTMFSFTGMWRSVCQGPSGMSGGRSHHPFSALHSSFLWHLGFFNLTD